MNARERRIIHTSLKDYPEVTTYSVGEGTGRRVVVDLKKEKAVIVVEEIKDLLVSDTSSSGHPSRGGSDWHCANERSGSG